MDRFDSMRMKGINTNDANATSSDILNGKTAYVAGKKLTGTLVPSSGGSYEDLGSEISIEAQGTIDKGDRIVATKNTAGTSPTLSKSGLGFTLGNLSKDMSVGVGSVTITSNSILPIYFENEDGTYDGYNLEIGDISEITSSSFSSSNMIINDDGSLIAYGGKKALVIETNKTNKTANYKIVSFGGLSYSQVTINNSNYDVTSVSHSVSKNNSAFAGDYLFARTYVLTSYTSSTYQTFTIFKYNGSSFKTVYSNSEYFNKTYIFKLGMIYDNDNLLVTFACSNDKVHGIMKYNMSSNTFKKATISLSNPTIDSIGNISSNGKYYMARNYLYDVNITDMTFTLNLDIRIYATFYPNDDGTLFLVNNSDLSYSIYNRSGKQVYSNGIIPINNIFTTKRWIGSTSIASITPSTEAEYLAKSINTFTMEENKIYGIASESLTAGMQGTARELFNTYTA